MVYETDFYTTRRSYGSRPVTSSYSVSCPVSRTYSGSTRVYTSSYPIYSFAPRITRRVISSPIRTVYSTPIVRTRIITSPIRTTRVYSSPIRTTRVYSSPIRTTTTRVYSSPIRTTTTRVYTSPVRTLGYSSVYTAPIRTTRVIESPVRVYTTYPSYYRSSLTPERIITSPYRTLPSVLNREYSRIANRVRPGFGDHQLTSYLNSEPYINFEEETKRIRNSTNNLMRDLHTPVPNRSRSTTPFPAYKYEPTSKLTLDSYIARVTNPTRHLAKEVRNIVDFPEAPRKYLGKSHLASINIVGDKAYNIRNPLYSSDKVRTDINLLAYYIQRQRDGKLGNSNKVVVSNGVPDLDPFRPSRKFGIPAPLENPIDEETKEKQRLRQERFLAANVNLVMDEISVEKKRAVRNDEIKTMKSRVERTSVEDAIVEKKLSRRNAEMKRVDSKSHEDEVAQKAEAEAKKIVDEKNRVAQIVIDEAKVEKKLSRRNAEMKRVDSVSHEDELEKRAEAEAVTAAKEKVAEEVRVAKVEKADAAAEKKITRRNAAMIRTDSINHDEEVAKKAEAEAERQLAKEAAVAKAVHDDEEVERKLTRRNSEMKRVDSISHEEVLEEQAVAEAIVEAKEKVAEEVRVAKVEKADAAAEKKISRRNAAMIRTDSINHDDEVAKKAEAEADKQLAKEAAVAKAVHDDEEIERKLIRRNSEMKRVDSISHEDELVKQAVVGAIIEAREKAKEEARVERVEIADAAAEKKITRRNAAMIRTDSINHDEEVAKKAEAEAEEQFAKEAAVAKAVHDDEEVERKLIRRNSEMKRVDSISHEEVLEEQAVAEAIVEAKEKVAEEARVERVEIADAAAEKKISRRNAAMIRTDSISHDDILAKKAEAEAEIKHAEEAAIEREQEVENKMLRRNAEMIRVDSLNQENEEDDAAKLEEAKKVEEEERKARDARIAEQARLAEEAKKANEARLAEEQKAREEELNRLNELEKIAAEEREAELARQAAELAEIARQEGEIAAKELQAIQQSNTASSLADEETKPVIEEPQTPVDESPAPIAHSAVNIDEVKSDVDE